MSNLPFEGNISIVIRSYNEEKHIGKLLRGINFQTVKNVEVIVVDSGSTDRTVEIAKRHGAKTVQIAKSEFSFGRALNIGCEVASGDYLIFASAHVYPIRNDWIEKLIEPFSDASIVLSYGRQVGDDLTKYSEKKLFEAWFPLQSTKRQPHNFCNNANCAVRRSVWEQQRYDEVLTGLEDLAWAKVARKNGGQIAYVADATIAHIHEETWNRVRNRYRREALALRQIEPTISFGFLDFLSLTVNNIFHDLLAAYRENCLFSVWQSVLFFRFNQFYGTWRGHKMHGEIDSALRGRFYYPNGELKADKIETKSSSLDSAIINYD